MTIKVYPNTQKLYHMTAMHILEIAGKAIREKGAFYIALSGGETPKGLFKLFGKDYYRKQTDWTHTHVFWSDERCVPPNDPESNYRAAYRLCLEKCHIPKNHIHRVPTEKPPLEAARFYQEEILSTLGTPPVFDLILLGLGTDGHTASIFPETLDSFSPDEPDKWVAARYIQKLSAWRITFTPRLINAAKEVLFLVAGAHKASILHAILSESSDSGTYPACLIHPDNGKTVWFVDEAAGSLLSI